MKRLTIFELQEGKTYFAFDGDRKLGKSYRMVDGKLQNAQNGRSSEDDLGNSFGGCHWVPLQTNIGFEERTDIPVVASSAGYSPVIKNTAKVSILHLKENMAYKADRQFNGVVARLGNKLMKLDGDYKPLFELQEQKVDLETVFTPVMDLKTMAEPTDEVAQKAFPFTESEVAFLKALANAPKKAKAKTTSKPKRKLGSAKKTLAKKKKSSRSTRSARF